ncbi:MAG: hypothetical protein IJ555_05865 [Ruminococcus sp.]|nr:hypothetical protein [Ruminococcus sp.]MBR1751577.1 hypothetical protein [Ruminococcus sp.]
MRRVVITGFSAVCANASDKEQLERLCGEGLVGLKECRVFSTEGLLTDKFGYADISAEDRTKELIRIAGEQMLADAGVDKEYISAMGRACRMFYGTLMSSAPYYIKNSENNA